MSEHTKEPWTPIKDGNPAHRNEAWHIEGINGDLVTYGHMSEQDARRIVACVNACEGIPTGMLEAGDAEILAYSMSIKKQRDELLAALKWMISTGLTEYEHSRFMSNPDHYARLAIAKAEQA